MNKFIILAILLVGCTPPTPEERFNNEIKQNTELLSRSVEYYKDVNKNVCYAGAWLHYHGAVLTYVPCTPEIERTAHKFHSNQTVR